MKWLCKNFTIHIMVSMRLGRWMQSSRPVVITNHIRSRDPNSQTNISACKLRSKLSTFVTSRKSWQPIVAVRKISARPLKRTNSFTSLLGTSLLLELGVRCKKEVKEYSTGEKTSKPNLRTIERQKMILVHAKAREQVQLKFILQKRSLLCPL